VAWKRQKVHLAPLGVDRVGTRLGASRLLLQADELLAISHAFRLGLAVDGIRRTLAGTPVDFGLRPLASGLRCRDCASARRRSRSISACRSLAASSVSRRSRARDLRRLGVHIGRRLLQSRSLLLAARRQLGIALRLLKAALAGQLLVAKRRARGRLGLTGQPADRTARGPLRRLSVGHRLSLWLIRTSSAGARRRRRRNACSGIPPRA
jgi:hypothetical protein